MSEFIFEWEVRADVDGELLDTITAGSWQEAEDLWRDEYNEDTTYLVGV